MTDERKLHKTNLQGFAILKRFKSWPFKVIETQIKNLEKNFNQLSAISRGSNPAGFTILKTMKGQKSISKVNRNLHSRQYLNSFQC